MLKFQDVRFREKLRARGEVFSISRTILRPRSKGELCIWPVNASFVGVVPLSEQTKHYVYTYRDSLDMYFDPYRNT